MNVLVLGQGAIGLLFYASLLPIADLRLKASTTSRQLSSFTITKQTGLSTQVPVRHFEVKENWQPDLLLVCVKSYQLEQALTDVLALPIAPCPIIVSHNGMGCISGEILLRLSSFPLLTLLTTHGSLKSNKAHVMHTGKGQSDLGISLGQIPFVEQFAIVSLLNQALPVVNWRADIAIYQWQKLLVNCAINPLTASENVLNGELANARFTPRIELLVAEVVAVAKACGIELVFDEMLDKAYQVIQATAKNSSSMRQDILQQRRTEIDYISGFVVRQAEELGLSVPENLALYQKINAISNA